MRSAMNNDESLFAQLGVAGTMPPLPDEVWERVLSIALDPTTPAVDPELVPEMDDLPVVPDDGDIVLYDDTDDAPLVDASHDSLVDDVDGLDVGEVDEVPAPDVIVDHEMGTFDVTGDEHPDLTVDDGPDLGGDLY
jgi:hypothetical protein